MGAALGQMVLAYSASAGDQPVSAAAGRLGEARSRFLSLVELDSQAYADTVAARRAAKANPAPAAEEAWTSAIRHAAEVPLETARLAEDCAKDLRELEDQVRSYMKSDWTVALGLLNAGRDGAAANVAINVGDLRDRGAEVADLEAAIRDLA